MKNQYMGDIGDFAKYYLLRQLAKSRLKIGVNWYLTEDDPTKGDGKHVGYLFNMNSEERKVVDPELCDVLRRLLYEDKRSIIALEESNILPAIGFYNVHLNRSTKRNEWFDVSLDELKGANILFFDPDNGMKRGNDSSQHASYDEIGKAYNAGKSVVIYQHGGVREEKGWLDGRVKELITEIDKAHTNKVYTTDIYWNNIIQQRFFIILWQKEHKKIFDEESIEDSILEYLKKY
jgi:hypothetical protein